MSRIANEQDRTIKTALRKRLQPKMKDLRTQVKGQLVGASGAEAEQFAVLDAYALGVLTALNRDGTLPFAYPAVRASEDLDEVETSLQHLAKKGRA
jgi:hypothetical protein